MLSKIRGSWVRATREIDLYIYILSYIGLKKIIYRGFIITMQKTQKNIGKLERSKFRLLIKS